MLIDPNTESPANVDASVMFKNDKQAYNKKLRQLAQKSI
jgi:ubiquitin-conjugating enzyme E2 G1